MLSRLLPRRFPQRYTQRFPHKAPQLSPQALAQAFLSAVALAVLCGCTTSPPRTARPQAIPLPDYQRVATTPGATPRERIVEIALLEWHKWGDQVVRIGRDDSACVTQSPLPPPVLEDLVGNANAVDANGQASADQESDEDGRDANCVRFPDGTGMESTQRGCAMAQRYWGIVGEAPTCRQVTQGAWAWSAVFISWVMRKAGLNNDQFLTGQSHSMYVVDARDGKLARPAFHIVPTPALPRPGDLICAPRGRDKYLESPAEIGFGTTPMHCDIVVEVDPSARVVKAIGGNVQQSVSMDVIDLNDAGQLDAFTNSHMPWLLVMRNNLQ
ncbi:hypothetical protein SAMN05216345_106163 [Cupriavidus sp. YR651]|uniref:DUF2272 domain-containing protein n=1 Tax=Cupriavidus sp. YR651 TaxID=1855315 RepID=UPI00088AE4AF|nr:DUF2272 domain-containing protein [Cupriavidus sp. YR651]SDD13999.1 hypothetical protein SAMN05216345_106163 [Cupriavidus sp. YR651]